MYRLRMARGAPPPEKNDGGLIVALVLLMGALSAVFFSAIRLYASADEYILLSNEKKEKCVQLDAAQSCSAGPTWATQ